MDKWASKDPLENYLEFLRNEDILSEEQEVEIKKKIIHDIDDNLQLAFDESSIPLDKSKELNDVYKLFNYEEVTPNDKLENIRLVDAISQGLRQAMEKHDDLVIMGARILPNMEAFSK